MTLHPRCLSVAFPNLKRHMHIGAATVQVHAGPLPQQMDSTQTQTGWFNDYNLVCNVGVVRFYLQISLFGQRFPTYSDSLQVEAICISTHAE